MPDCSDRIEFKQQLKKDMATRLRTLRKTTGWSQQFTSEKADISQQALSDAESSKTMLMPDTLLKLSLAYNVSVDFILTGKCSDSDMQRELERARKFDSKIFFHWQIMNDHFFAALQDLHEEK